MGLKLDQRRHPSYEVSDPSPEPSSFCIYPCSLSHSSSTPCETESGGKQSCATGLGCKVSLVTCHMPGGRVGMVVKQRYLSLHHKASTLGPETKTRLSGPTKYHTSPNPDPPSPAFSLLKRMPNRLTPDPFRSSPPASLDSSTADEARRSSATDEPFPPLLNTSTSDLQETLADLQQAEVDMHGGVYEVDDAPEGMA